MNNLKQNASCKKTYSSNGYNSDCIVIDDFDCLADYLKSLTSDKDNTIMCKLTDYQMRNNYFRIQKVIFNDPATIILWSDGSKTVVKAENEEFDPEKGLAMAISKKALGNEGNYYNVFKEWLRKYDGSANLVPIELKEAVRNIRGFLKTKSSIKYTVDWHPSSNTYTIEIASDNNE